MTALSFVWVHPYSQNSGCDKTKSFLLLNSKFPDCQVTSSNKNSLV